MSSKPRGRISLLGSKDVRPEGDDWRADALAQSAHSRLDGVELPREDFDEERALDLCAEVCRRVLRDFAPCLVLIPEAERRRVQCLVAYTHTLFDFARQPGLQGERLTEINRWEYTLERALMGEAVGQPIFLRFAAEERRRPWPREALEELGRAARHRVSVEDEKRDSSQLHEEHRGTVAAFARSLLDRDLPRPALDFGAALLRIHSLQSLTGEPQLLRHALAGAFEEADLVEPIDTRTLGQAVRRECALLRPLLLGMEGAVDDLPQSYRRAAGYLRGAGLRLLARIERQSGTALDRPVKLGLFSRIGLLLRTRWL